MASRDASLLRGFRQTVSCLSCTMVEESHPSLRDPGLEPRQTHTASEKQSIMGVDPTGPSAILLLPLSSCAIVGKLSNLSVPRLITNKMRR